MIIEIEGSKIKTQQDLHDELKILMELPEYYGENLDALWDCLTGWIDLPVEIVWRDFDISKRYLENYADKVVELMEDASKELVGFSYRLI